MESSTLNLNHTKCRYIGAIPHVIPPLHLILLPIRMFALELSGKTWKLALRRMQRKPRDDFVPTPLIQPPPLLPSPVAISLLLSFPPYSPSTSPPYSQRLSSLLLACFLSSFPSFALLPSLPLFLLSLILSPFPPQAAKVPRKEGEIRNVVAPFLSPF